MVSALGLAACVSLSPVPAFGDSGDDPLFTDHSVLEIELHGPLRAIARDSDPDPEERPGLLRQGDDEFEIKLAPRGKSRRQRSRCQFPPLWVNLKKKSTDGTLFDGQNKLKLVTHCRSLTSRESLGADYLWLEYLAYRMFNEITDLSFRVRPLRVIYVDVDEDGEQERYPHPGFFIEHKKRLAKRIDQDAVDVLKISMGELVPQPAQDVEMLQYLLGNTDFSLIRGPAGDNCCHNVVLFSPLDSAGPYTPIPYDFDNTGWVDPPGATPATNLGLRRLSQRLYRGFCRAPEHLTETVARFNAARASLEDLISGHSGLSDRAKKKALGYVERFYAVLSDPKKLEREIADDCRGKRT